MLDKAMLGLGLSGACVALRWTLSLDPRIALLSQLIFSVLPAVVQPAALGLWQSCQCLSFLATWIVYRSTALAGAFLNIAGGIFSNPPCSAEALGGVLLVIAAISSIILLPAMIMVPFIAAKGAEPIVIAGINITLSMGYFAYKHLAFRGELHPHGLPIYNQAAPAA